MSITAQGIHHLHVPGAVPESHQSFESKDFIPGLSAALNMAPSEELVKGIVHFLGAVG